MGEAFDNFIDGMGDFIGQGADEVASALFTGNAYDPRWMAAASPVESAQEAAPVEAAPVESIEAPAMESGWGEQAPMGFPEIGFSDNATVIDMEPQIEAMAPESFTLDYTPAEPQQQQEIEL